MQSVSSRILTRVTVSISYDDNHYTTGTSRKLSIDSCWVCSHFEGFQYCFPFPHLFGYVCFLYLLSYRTSLSWMDENFKTKIFVSHRPWAYSTLLFSYVLSLPMPSLYFSRSLLKVLLITFHVIYSIQQFCYVISVSIFYSKYILFLLQPVVDLSYHLHQLVGRILFRFLGMFCFKCSTLSRHLLSLPSFANIFWLISSSSCDVRVICDCLFGDLFISFGFYAFYLPKQFYLLSKFLYLCFPIHFFYFSSDSFRGCLFYLQLISPLRR